MLARFRSTDPANGITPRGAVRRMVIFGRGRSVGGSKQYYGKNRTASVRYGTSGGESVASTRRPGAQSTNRVVSFRALKPHACIGDLQNDTCGVIAFTDQDKKF